MESSYYHKAMIVATVGIFYTNVPAYVYSLHSPSFEPKYWVFALCVSVLPFVLKQNAWPAVRSPLMGWCFGYALVAIIWFFPSIQSDMVWSEVRTRFLTILTMITFILLFWNASASDLARKVLVGAVLFGAGLNIYELFVPMSFSQVLGRSAGLYENPTMSGEALVLGMILSVTVLAPRYRVAFLLLTGIGILTTFSRASILVWAIAVAGLIFVERMSAKDFIPSISLVLVLGFLVLLPQWDHLLTTWERNGMLNENVEERLAWFTDPSGVSDYSSWERKYLAQRAWERTADRPFLGGGTGSFREAYMLPHNQYLVFMLDHGLVGAFIVPLLMLAVIHGARGKIRGVAIVFGCAVIVLSFFTHTIMSTNYSLLLFALTAAMAFGSRDREAQPALAWSEKRSTAAPGLLGA